MNLCQVYHLMFVIWAPFHDLHDDGGVYYVPQKDSFKTIKIEHSQGFVNGPIDIRQNEQI